MKNSIILLLGLVLTLLSISSCKTREKLVYFQEGNLDSLANQQANFTPTFKVDDFLSIIVTAQEPESVIPFNLITITSQTNGVSGYSNGNPSPNGYLIDTKGNINFPILGEIRIGGLTREEAVNLIQGKLKDYLVGPGVQIQILNYKVTVLGDVKSPGTYKIPNERLTLLEGIGLAGDLNITGGRKNILVIREENDQKIEYRVDLTKKEIFSSPVYYLQQNDVVYVEPNVTARSSSTIWRTSGGIFISLTSLIITTIVLITR